jgi:hypothetical protein
VTQEEVAQASFLKFIREFRVDNNFTYRFVRRAVLALLRPLTQA